jgi:hypothetical protein
MSADQRRCVNLGKKLAQKGAPKKASPYAERIPDPVVQAPAKGASLEIKKAVASPRAPADQSTEAKASIRKKGQAKGQAKGQESPETKVSTPMETRSQEKNASGAGSLRGMAGSGQTGSGKGKPSSTRKPGS